MRNGLAVLAVTSVLFCAPLAHAQDSLTARMAADSIGNVQPGSYLAGDVVKFLLDRYGNKFLLRYSGDPEIYVLYIDRASVGGRVLKYDSGTTAISVAGWGGMTLYTDQHPEGLPAVRTGDSNPPSLSSISQNDVQNAADDEQQHLAYTRHFKIAVVIDWNEIGSNGTERAQAFDAMQNTVRGIDRFTANSRTRAAMLKIDTLNLSTTGSKPTATITGKTLFVTYNRGQGFAGRASSRAIARALGLLLHMKAGN